MGPHHSLFIFLLYLKFVFNSVAKHGEVCGKLVEELFHNLGGQLVHVDLLEAASTSSTSLLESPVLPRQLQRCLLVFADSQTVKEMRPLLGKVLVLDHISKRQLADPASKADWHPVLVPLLQIFVQKPIHKLRSNINKPTHKLRNNIKKPIRKLRNKINKATHKLRNNIK